MKDITPRIDGEDFDSKLSVFPSAHPVNCELTVTLRVTMWFVDHPRFKKGTPTVRTRPWKDQEVQDFRFYFHNNVQQFWDKRFWLLPPGHFSTLDLPLDRPTHRPNVRCRFRLEIVQTVSQQQALGNGAKWHAEVQVLQPTDREGLRSGMSGHEDRDKGGPFNKLVLKGSDAMPEDMGARIHLVSAHEVGHLLLLAHPGCPGNQAKCYGRTELEKDEIMAGGMAVTARMAKPWTDRIAQHTKTLPGSWRVAMRDVPPRLLFTSSGMQLE